MSFSLRAPIAVLLFTVCAAGTALAAPIPYFGEDQAPGQTVSPIGEPMAARNAFVAGLLPGIGTETFEDQVPGIYASLPISFPGSGGGLINATITGTGTVFESPSFAGRFNTTGATLGPVFGQWWSSTAEFTIVFETPISAFGFFATDTGDFGGTITIALMGTDDVVTELDVGNTSGLPGTPEHSDGALLFWGFIDPTAAYKSITIFNTAGGTDFFGFDDMIVGDLGQVIPPSRVPEPATVALIGIALLGLGATRRRRG